VTHSTVDDNLATSFQSGALVVDGKGGGVYANVHSPAGTANTLLNFVNDTIAYNSAVTSAPGTVADGGGLYLTGMGTVRLISLNSLTVAYNYADNKGGGMCVDNAALLPWVRNCAFDLNVAAVMPDVFGAAGAITSQGFNLLTTFNPNFVAFGDAFFADLLLDTALANNGGPTLTLKPLQASPVIAWTFFPINAQPDDPTDDQRYFARAAGWTNCGAYGP
jgi:hypothetical protein